MVSASSIDLLSTGEPRVWLIAGPTASGKTALALRLAEATGGEIVNADSMQLYRELRVLTARPSPEEEARAPHHLFGFVPAAEPWSVGDWLRAVLPVLNGIAGRRRLAIVVGGTGLYLHALTRGLAEVPAVPEGVRDELAARYDAEGEVAFRRALAAVDIETAAAIAPGDRQRLLRAAAVHAATGRSLSDWQADTRPALKPEAWRGVVLDPPRAELYARCDARLTTMLQGGALEEVAAFIDAHPLHPSPPGEGSRAAARVGQVPATPPTDRDAERLAPRSLATRAVPPQEGRDLPLHKALGVRELAAHLAGEVTLAEALAAAQRATRNYAKRQTTWFRNQTPEWPRLDAEEQ